MPSITTGIRSDGFIDKPKDYSNSIQEHWIHKEVVKHTGKGEDEFVIIHKPFMVDKVDLKKRIQEEAKGTDLKSLVMQVLQTGNIDLLNQRQGSYVDITGYPEDTMTAMNNLVRGNDILGQLPDELKGKSLEDLVNMSNDDIGAFVKDSIAKAVANVEKGKAAADEVKADPVVEKESEVK